MDRLGDSDEFTHEQLDAAETYMAFALLALGNPKYVDGEVVRDEAMIFPDGMVVHREGHDGR